MADSKVKLKTQQITSFNSGVFSPDMAGRVDLEAFASSARKITNFLPAVTGGLKKFYGSTHISEIDKPDDFILVPFINSHEPMCLVLHDGSVGLLTTNSYEELNQNLPITSGYDRLRWQQINDRIFFVHPTTQPFAIDFYGASEDGYIFIQTSVQFEEVPYFPIGFTGDYSGKLKIELQEGTSGLFSATIPEHGSIAVLDFPEPVANTSSYTRIANSVGASAQYTVPQSKIYLYKDTGEEIVSGSAGNYSDYTFRRSDGQLMRRIEDTITREGILKTIQTRFPKSTIEGSNIKIVDEDGAILNSGDKIYLELVTNDITYYSDVIVPGATTVSETATVANERLTSTELVGRKIKIYSNSTSIITPWVSGDTVSENDIRYSNGSFYKALSSGTCGTKQPSHLFGTTSDGKINWKYIHSGSVSGTITDVISDYEFMIKISGDKELPYVSAQDATDKIFDTFAWSIWGFNNTHPSDIYLTQNRLGFICNTGTFGAWNALSVTDKFFDFSTEQYGQQLDTSAIVHAINNNPDNKINWVLSYKTIYMGSDTNEFSISAPNKILTPTTLSCDRISSLGGAAVVPLKYKELNLFTGSNKDELYTIGYDYTIEDYVPKSIGYITNHLLEQGITRLSAISNKDQNVYILHDTGSISVLNYVGDQGILSYSNIDACSPVLDFCSTSSNANRVAYMAVERNSGRVSFEYIAEEKPTYMWNVVEYEGEEVSSFDLPIFANKTVYIITDGQFEEKEIDSTGHYEFKTPTNNYAVGIKMTSEVHTQPAFGRKAEGVVQQSVKVSLRLLESGAFEYGDSTDFNKYIKFDNWGADQDLGEPHKLYTGDALLDLASGYLKLANEGKGPYPNDTGVGINIKSYTPEPFNLLSVTEVYV